MIIKKLLAVILTFGVVMAHAAPVTITEAHEVPLEYFRVPVSTNDQVEIRSCDGCEVTAVRLNSATQFRVNKEIVSLREFRQQVFQLRDRSRYTVIVMHHLESDTILSVSIKI